MSLATALIRSEYQAGHEPNVGLWLACVSQLAKQMPRLDVRRLKALAGKMVGKSLAAVADFLHTDASGMIDTLKSIKVGEIELARISVGTPRSALSSATAWPAAAKSTPFLRQDKCGSRLALANASRPRKLATS